ncbi:ribonuclease H-like domain-containing protein [Rhizophagus clarus]|nr:ribonuclease H-like domain-containing protein [Rhizophagus clarus]
MFMDQICSIDGSFLLPYKDIKNSLIINGKEKYLTGTRRSFVTTRYPKTSDWLTLSRTPLYKILTTTRLLNQEEYASRNQWIVFWNASTSIAVYGKTLHQINRPGANSITQIQHYLPLTLMDNQLDLTPWKRLAILQPCRSCNRHTYNVDNPLLYTFYMSTSSLITFKTTPANKIPIHIPDKKKYWRYPSQPFLTLQTLAYNYYLTLTRSFKHPSHFDNPVDTSQPDFLLNYKDLNYNFIPNTPYFICNIFAGNDNVIQSLINLSIEFVNRSNFSFYTDGSLHTEGPLKSCLGFGWLEVGSPPHTFTFKGSMIFQPSSTRAEIFSILTCLITVLYNSTVNIYTDSQNFISTYNNINNPCFSHPLMVPTFNLNGPLEKDLRKWSKNTLECYNMLSTINNSSNAYLFNKARTHPIDWHNTFLWIKCNNDNTICSNLNDKITGFKIKSFNHTLPTSDLQQRNYPNLFPPGPINCTACNNLVINNAHIGFCPTHLTTLNNSLQHIKEAFTLRLINTSDVPSSMDIKAWVERSPIFSPVTNDDHPVYLILHQCVPSTLTSLIKMFIKNTKNRQSMIIFFMELFFKDITRPFWKLHSSLMHAWKKARNITRKKKVKYRKKNKKGISAPASDNPTNQLSTS